MIGDMAMPRREALTDDQLQGFKYFKTFLPLAFSHVPTDRC
jgi:hypothetical protein